MCYTKIICTKFLLEVNKINIAICEDNLIEADLIYDYLESHLKKNGYNSNIHRYEKGEALLDAFSLGAFSIVFLDIYMSGMTGIQTAKKLRAIDPNFALVFITSSKEHALEAFDCQACAYVTKPVEQHALEKVFKQCEKIFIQNARTIQIMSDRKLIKVPITKIFYIEIYHKDALFHTTSGVFKTNMSLNDIEEKLGLPFIRCHRSYLVNMNHIKQIEEHAIVMNDGDQIAMRQRGKATIREIYGDFLSNNLFGGMN